MELVRYIHLNPLRANIVKSMAALDEYSFSGQKSIMLLGGTGIRNQHGGAFKKAKNLSFGRDPIGQTR